MTDCAMKADKTERSSPDVEPAVAAMPERAEALPSIMEQPDRIRSARGMRGVPF